MGLVYMLLNLLGAVYIMSFAEELKQALRIMLERKRGNYNNNWYRETSQSMPSPNRYHPLYSNYYDYTHYNRTPWNYHHRDMNTYQPPPEPMSSDHEYVPPAPPVGSGMRKQKKKTFRRKY
jgi:hypothetical protein